MESGALFEAGKLQEALADQLSDVKKHPADQNKRVFLFELLVLTGDLERARKQIDVVRYPNPDQQTTVEAYRKLLDGEEQRRRFIAEAQPPKFLSDPPEHVRQRLDAAKLLSEKQFKQANDLLLQAAEGAPAAPGILNETPVEHLRDADDLFGEVLEAFVHGVYHWVPLKDVQTLTIKPPRAPRDLIWIPAQLETKHGSAGQVFLPALYPNSHLHPDDLVKLGRSTDWTQTDDGPVLGIGQKTFLRDDEGIGLLEFRTFVAR